MLRLKHWSDLTDSRKKLNIKIGDEVSIYNDFSETPIKIKALDLLVDNNGMGSYYKEPNYYNTIVFKFNEGDFNENLSIESQISKINDLKLDSKDFMILQYSNFRDLNKENTMVDINSKLNHSVSDFVFTKIPKNKYEYCVKVGILDEEVYKNIIKKYEEKNNISFYNNIGKEYYTKEEFVIIGLSNNDKMPIVRYGDRLYSVDKLILKLKEILSIDNFSSDVFQLFFSKDFSQELSNKESWEE